MQSKAKTNAQPLSQDQELPTPAPHQLLRDSSSNTPSIFGTAPMTASALPRPAGMFAASATGGFATAPVAPTPSAHPFGSQPDLSVHTQESSAPAPLFRALSSNPPPIFGTAPTAMGAPRQNPFSNITLPPSNSTFAGLRPPPPQFQPRPQRSKKRKASDQCGPSPTTRRRN